MQPGKNIAAGISKAGDSIADAVTKYQAVRERDAIVRGKVEAVIGSKMKQQDADSWFNQQGEETQRLLVKFQGGKETHDDLLKLGSYLDVSETISQRDEAAKMQKVAYDTAALNLQRLQGTAADDEAIRKSATAGMAAPDTTSYRETRQDIPVEQANALASYGAAHFKDLPGGGAVPGLDVGALNKYNDELALHSAQESGGYTVKNPNWEADEAKYIASKAKLEQALYNYTQDLRRAGNTSMQPAKVQPAATGLGAWVPHQYTETKLDAANRAAIAVEKRNVAMSGLGLTKNALAELEPAAEFIAASNTPTPVAPELTTSGVEKVTSRATSTEQFGVSLKHLTESGRATPKTIEALRDMFGIVDAKVESVNGITLVMQGGKIIQSFQNKNANDDLKPLTADENKKLEAIQSSEGDIDRIEAALKAGNSGVVVGMLQKFWPWAVDSKKVEAMRNAAVPNLARGVFGEVGVLTETDVKRYIAMIPGLNSSPTQQATLIKELRTKLAATKLNSIQSLAAGGRDVSGWVSGMASPAASSGGGGYIYDSKAKKVVGQ